MSVSARPRSKPGSTASEASVARPSGVRRASMRAKVKPAASSRTNSSSSPRRRTSTRSPPASRSTASALRTGLVGLPDAHDGKARLDQARRRIRLEHEVLVAVGRDARELRRVRDRGRLERRPRPAAPIRARRRREARRIRRHRSRAAQEFGEWRTDCAEIAAARGMLQLEIQCGLAEEIRPDQLFDHREFERERLDEAFAQIVAIDAEQRARGRRARLRCARRPRSRHAPRRGPRRNAIAAHAARARVSPAMRSARRASSTRTSSAGRSVVPFDERRLHVRNARWPPSTATTRPRTHDVLCVSIEHLATADATRAVAGEMDLPHAVARQGVEIIERVEAVVARAHVDVVDVEQHAAARSRAQARRENPTRVISASRNVEIARNIFDEQRHAQRILRRDDARGDVAQRLVRVRHGQQIVRVPPAGDAPAQVLGDEQPADSDGWRRPVAPGARGPADPWRRATDPRRAGSMGSQAGSPRARHAPRPRMRNGSRCAPRASRHRAVGRSPPHGAPPADRCPHARAPVADSVTSLRTCW